MEAGKGRFGLSRDIRSEVLRGWGSEILSTERRHEVYTVRVCIHTEQGYAFDIQIPEPWPSEFAWVTRLTASDDIIRQRV